MKRLTVLAACVLVLADWAANAAGADDQRVTAPEHAHATAPRTEECG